MQVVSLKNLSFGSFFHNFNQGIAHKVEDFNHGIAHKVEDFNHGVALKATHDVDVVKNDIHPINV